jgi:hypothetical protein
VRRQDPVDQLVAEVLDPQLAQHQRVVLAPGRVDLCVVAPGVVVRTVVVVPEPAVRHLPRSVHLLVGHILAVLGEQAAERIAEGAPGGEQREPGIQADESVAHRSPTVPSGGG